MVLLFFAFYLSILKFKYNLNSRAPCLAHGDCDNAATLPNALAVASGQSAQMHALLTFMQTGDNFISASELYGGTHTQFGHSFKQIGIEAKFADVSDIEQIKSLIDDNTKVRTIHHTCSIVPLVLISFFPLFLKYLSLLLGINRPSTSRL
ncbi:MAG: hypothetical protein ACI8RD_006530 [Bacillariaceae sp.]